MQSFLSKVIICGGLALAVTQGARADEPSSAPPATEKGQVTKPTKVIVNQDQLRKRLEERGIQSKKRSALAKKKAQEHQNPPPGK